MAIQEPEPEEPEEEIQKTVTIVGYVREMAEVSPRHWAQSYDRDTDYWDTYSRSYESTEYHIKSPDGVVELDEDEFLLLEGFDAGELKVERVKKEKESTGYRKSPKDAANKLKEEILNEVLEPIGPLFDVHPESWKLLRRDGESVCKVFTECEEMPMLKEHGELSEEDPYVDEDEELTVVKYRFSIRDVNEEEVDVISNQVIAPFMTGLGRHEEIKTIRMVDCETKKTEKGACLRV